MSISIGWTHKFSTRFAPTDRGGHAALVRRTPQHSLRAPIKAVRFTGRLLCDLSKLGPRNENIYRFSKNFASLSSFDMISSFDKVGHIRKIGEPEMTRLLLTTAVASVLALTGCIDVTIGTPAYASSSDSSLRGGDFTAVLFDWRAPMCACPEKSQAGCGSVQPISSHAIFTPALWRSRRPTSPSRVMWTDR